MIRRAEPLLDAERMAGVHAECFPDAWEAAAILAMLEDPGVAGFIDGAGDGFVIVRVAADEAEILTLAVTGAARRGGLARALLAAAAGHAREHGARRLFLEVAAGNAPARALYGAFAEIGRRRRYYADGDDALVLSLELEPAPLAGGGASR